MPEAISIKERIARLYILIIQGIGGIRKVYRWDGRGLRDPETGLDVDADGQRISMQNLDAMIVEADEVASEGGLGDIGTTIKKLPIEIHLKITQAEDDPESGSFMHNRWLLKLENAVMANPLLQEPGDAGQRLATDTDTTDTAQQLREEGQRESITAIRFMTQYEHYRDDPTAGPGITTLEV